MMSLKMGVSGDRGSFSEEAALLYAQRAGIHPILHYLIDMEGVLTALEQGEINLGILPVVNIQGGLVQPALQAMGKHLFNPVDELWLNVKQCLLAVPGTKPHQINTIVSHPQGLAQCRHYLEKEFKDVACVAWCDTAKAAYDLSEGLFSSNTAVIAPERSATIYGLDILAKNIQDSNPNLTAFILVTHISESL